MINAAHAVIHTKDPDSARAFFRDVIEFPCVDAGHGWLIFALPPAELGIHPTEGDGHHQLYLMCDDVEATVAELKAKGVEFTQPIKDVGWGVLTAMKVPGGGELYLYQPRHPAPPR